MPVRKNIFIFKRHLMPDLEFIKKILIGKKHAFDSLSWKIKIFQIVWSDNFWWVSKYCFSIFGYAKELFVKNV